MKTTIIALCLVLSALLAPALADEGENRNQRRKPRKPPLPTVLSLEASDWDIRYSSQVPSMPRTTSLGAWFFDMPGSRGWVGTVTTPYGGPMDGRTVVMTAQLQTTSGNPTYNYFYGADNPCLTPAHARPYFETKAFNAEFERWWSNPVAVQLQEGTFTVTIPLTPDRWSSVFGKFGNYSTASLAGFNKAMVNVAAVGMTFGGGCFFAHGVNVLGGTSRFILHNYAIIGFQGSAQ